MLDVMIENPEDIAVLRYSGRMVLGEELSTLFHSVMSQKNARTIVLDLTRVSQIDASGLGTLVFLRQWARGAGVKLQLIPSKRAEDLLDLTGLRFLFEVPSSEAVQSLSSVLTDSPQGGTIENAADD